jgi:hypothetical protein
MARVRRNVPQKRFRSHHRGVAPAGTQHRIPEAREADRFWPPFGRCRRRALLSLAVRSRLGGPDRVRQEPGSLRRRRGRAPGRRGARSFPPPGPMTPGAANFRSKSRKPATPRSIVRSEPVRQFAPATTGSTLFPRRPLTAYGPFRSHRPTASAVAYDLDSSGRTAGRPVRSFTIQISEPSKNRSTLSQSVVADCDSTFRDR